MAGPSHGSPRADALLGAAIAEVPVALPPTPAMLPRAPFPLLDLRRRAEEVAGFSGEAVFRKDSQYMAAEYAAPVEMKPDPVFAASEATLYGGAIWVGGELVPGSVHFRTLEEHRARFPDLLRHRKNGKLPRLPGTTALIHTPGFKNYFHWMTEALPRLTALSRYVAQGHGRLDRILVTQADARPFVADSVAAFFPDLLPLLEIVPTARYELEHALFFLDWRGVGNVRTRVKDTSAVFFDEIADRLPGIPRGPGRALLVSRADADNRRLVNEDALLAAFAPLGLEPVRFTGLAVAEQMWLMADARLVVGVHGAGLTNAIFCRPGTAVLEITSTQYIRRARSYADIAAYRGFPYALAVADQVGDAWVVEKNRGNDLEIAADALPQLRAAAESLLAAASPG